MGFFNKSAGASPFIPQRPQHAMPQDPQRGQQLADPLAMANELAANPAKFGEIWNLPKGMTDEQQMLDYLVQTGQVDPNLLRNPLVRAAAKAIAARMG